MDFDAYDYLEKSVEEAESRKRDGVEKSHRRRRNDKDDEDEIGDIKSKRSKLEVQNGDENGSDKRSSRPERERRDKDRHKSSRDSVRDDSRRSKDARVRDKEDSKRDKHKDKEVERLREKDRERKEEKEKDRETDRDKYRSRRHPSDPDKGTDREVPRGKSRDVGDNSRERDREFDIRKYKEKKELVEPEVDPERDQRTVFAYQMSLKANERDVYDFFSQAGKVRDVRLIMDRNSRRSKGVGYVEFYDAMSVPMAIALSGHQFLGQPVMVKPSEAEKNLVQSTSGVSGSLIGSYGAVARKLYVGNLHFNMTEEQLRQVFESFGPVELVQLPLDLETGQCKGYGFVQFSQLEHAKAAQSLNGKLDIAGRVIKVSAVTDHLGLQNSGANAADFDDDEGGGLSLNAQSRSMLMQKLDRTGVATSIAGSLGVPSMNGSAPIQQTIGLPMNAQAAVPAPVIPALVASSPAAEPIGNPSVCLLLKNMFDPATEMDPDFDLEIRDEVHEECSNFGPVKHIYVDKNSAGHVYLRFETVTAASGAQNAMHMRWFARRLISALYMQPSEYEAKFSRA